MPCKKVGGTKVPGNESSSERKVQGTKVPKNFRSSGTKGPGNESSRELSFPGNESSRERSLGNERSWARKVPVPFAVFSHTVLLLYFSAILLSTVKSRKVQ